MFLLRQEPENMPNILKDRIYYTNCLSTIQEVKKAKTSTCCSAGACVAELGGRASWTWDPDTAGDAS